MHANCALSDFVDILWGIFTSQAYQVHFVPYILLASGLFLNQIFSLCYFIGCKQLPSHPIKLFIPKHFTRNMLLSIEKYYVKNYQTKSRWSRFNQFISALNSYAKLWDNCSGSSAWSKNSTPQTKQLAAAKRWRYRKSNFRIGCQSRVHVCKKESYQGCHGQGKISGK